MIPAELVRDLRYLEVITARKIRNLRVGPYTSPLRGSGFDFDQHLPYRPGDDVRRIDWNVTARLNAPYVRETHAERELNIVLAMDLSRSMDLGSTGRTKKEMLTLVTGSLLFSAASDQINVGFLAFSDQAFRYDQPRRARARSWTILRNLWAIRTPQSRTTILPAVRRLLTDLKRISIIFLISDFLTDEKLSDSPELGVLATRHDVVAIVLEDPAEAALPTGQGYLRVRDLETGREATVRLGAHSRQVFAHEAQQRRRELIRTFFRYGIDHVFISPTEDFVEPLLRLFALRKRR